ncbi:hypothetical protein [Pseudonocardia sp. NPDC046786]|uniref:hypothetical protein n=1 Tax=Pseudonocardia sp. NPDC046786 TaxID=3155471 RepID=UPI0033CF650B
MIEPWQVPLVVTGVLTGGLSLVWLVSRSRLPSGLPGWMGRAVAAAADYVRTSLLVLPTIALALLAFGLLGDETLSRMLQLLTAVTAVIAAVVTVRTFQEERAARSRAGAHRAEDDGGPR